MDEYKKLWLRVVIQAIDDFLSMQPLAANPGEGKLAKLQAKHWFKKNSSDYQAVCSMADVNSDKLRRLVLLGDKYRLLQILEKYRRLL